MSILQTAKKILYMCNTYVCNILRIKFLSYLVFNDISCSCSKVALNLLIENFYSKLMAYKFLYYLLCPNKVTLFKKQQTT